jgi:hypothetical protein
MTGDHQQVAAEVRASGTAGTRMGVVAQQLEERMRIAPSPAWVTLLTIGVFAAVGCSGKGRARGHYLLTIGYDAADQGDFAFFTGVLLQIFDVSDPANLKLAHKVVIGSRGSSSEALTTTSRSRCFRARWPSRRRSARAAIRTDSLGRT